MTLFWHELRRGRLSLLIWTAAIAFMMALSIMIYPEMTAQMEAVNEAFADMGSFSAAFGMDQLNFGEFIGYFAVECGETLGLGGGLFAALLGIGMLSKEEREHTAEYLLTQPISRNCVVLQKLLALLAQLLLLNIAVFGVSALCTVLIGERVEHTVLLLFFANFLLQMELACVCFGLSAFCRRGAVGIGLGLTLALYFLNLASNITEKVEFLKYFTPFAYAEGAELVGDGLPARYVFIGLALALAGIGAAFWKYRKKDIG